MSNYYESMFGAAVVALAEISKALGIPDDEAACANGNELILEAIAELQAAKQPVGEVTGEGVRYETFIAPEVQWSVSSLPVGTTLYAARGVLAVDGIFTEDEWVTLAQTHVGQDWNCEKPDGYLNAVKELVRDAFATAGVKEEDGRG